MYYILTLEITHVPANQEIFLLGYFLAYLVVLQRSIPLQGTSFVFLHYTLHQLNLLNFYVSVILVAESL